MSDLDDLVDDRSDPDARSVLEDLHWTRSSRPPTRLGLALSIYDTEISNETGSDILDSDSVSNDGDDDAAAATDDEADNAEGADGVDIDTDLDPRDANDHAARITELLTKELDMRDGLKIIQVPGCYGWSVTRVGWMRRVVSDEWELIGARTIIRRSESSPRPLDSLASLGPGDDHVLTPASEAPEEIHRLVVRRSLPASLAAWGEYCPSPDGWQDDDR